MVKFIGKASALLVRQFRSLVSGGTDLRPELAELRIKLTELLTQTSQLSDALRHANDYLFRPGICRSVSLAATCLVLSARVRALWQSSSLSCNARANVLAISIMS